MRTPYLLLALVLTLSIGCTSKTKKILNSSTLPSQIVTIDPARDTSFKTKRGAVIKIPKGALQADGQSTVQLEIKEAYSISEMILGGLVTQSDGKPLSSGGMIYIDAVGEKDLKITKPISVAIPTATLDKNMQLYKGELESDGTINWKDPKPLTDNPQLTALEKGKILFMNNCASCHGIGNKVTGPSLDHILKRDPWNSLGWEGSLWTYQITQAVDTFNADYLSYDNLLYSFTRDNQRVMKNGPKYLTCLYNSYAKTPMPPFPNLTDEDLDNLYAYIENESELLNLPIPRSPIIDCYDSCLTYIRTRERLVEIKEKLEKDSTDMTELSFIFPQSAATPSNDSYDWIDTIPTLPALDKVVPLNNKSLYYQFKIEATGWYNVDQMVAEYPGVVDSKLAVRVQGEYQDRFDIFLVIPSVKLFVEGGKLNIDQGAYGFDTKDGIIPLPQNRKAYILAMGEFEDKIIFAKKEFNTSMDVNLEIELKQVTREFIDQEIKALSLQDLIIEAKETKNAEELRNTIRQIKKAEELKPRNCDCECFFSPLVSNSMPVPGAEGDYVY